MGKKTTQNVRNGVVAGAIASGMLLLMCGAVGHAADETKAVTPEQATFFESKIRPLLANHCYECHGGAESKGGLKLDSLASMLKGNAHGPALVVGDPEKSALLKAVHYDGAIKMPPSGKLRPEEIAALSAWIKMGAPWPTTAVPGGKNPGQAPDLVLTSAQKSFWSFRPIVKPALPKVKNAAWCISPIDRFILAKLEEKGLKPASSADRPTLIRRAYFDLIGLPPTPEQVEAFINDKSPDAWSKVVESLLANPHYGERWGRHWLDLVRYSDSNGLDENVAFANAFHYRDYVVNAYNRDVPYNQFMTEQLAGDLLPPADQATQNERLTATGFLSMGAKVLAEPDKEKMVMDIVDEQIEVTSKAFMGLTVACARCHNHKFDPIPTKDYYALAGIFKSTKTMSSLNTVAMWQERPLVTPQTQKEMAEHQAKIQAAETDLNGVKTHANTELSAQFHKDQSKYLQAAWELSQQHEPMSVAEMPVQPGDPPRIEILATQFNRGTVHRDTDNFGKGIGGIIHNVGTPDIAEYDVNIPTAGNYQVELRYAAAESRPVHLLLNGKLIKEDAAGKITGSFFPDGQKWELEGVYAFRQGKNVFKIESNNAIPHFHKILIVPVKPRPDGLPVRSAEEIAKQYGVNPSLVRYSVRFLGDVKTDPSKLAPADLQTAASRFGTRFKAPEKPEEFYSDDLKKQVVAAEKKFQALKAAELKPTMVMAVEEGKIEDCRVHVRGDTQNLGDAVPRHFLSVLDGDKIVARPGQSGRLDLAQWLANPDNPLTSRVEVNRIWQGHFGVGIVKTSENFGLLGSGATHPELLDWLARTFTEQGWSIKKMHRLILLSNTYKMSTVADPKTTELAGKFDTEDTLLWRMPRRRLEAEPFRDAILAVSGDLDLTMGGSLLTTANHDYVTNDQSGNAAQYNAHRRGIYLPIIRNALYDMFQAFDFGDPTMVNPHRATTTVAPQALFVMNSPFVLEQAKVFAGQLMDQKTLSDGERVKLAYMRAFSRPATSEEVLKCGNFLTKYADSLTASEPDPAKRRLHAWQSLCQIILASNEFLYVN